ncbi:hypothetical protein QFZ49_004760 [Streptomyces turgidiscabies]|uniref:Uncharacterized protein n=1 Tax=Streptomyces turgidiscabies TaxID=85558 RepID=A0ABU0RS66_9ACTN|nr:hypothetical protein [Streptomyces turgidiscabies]
MTPQSASEGARPVCLGISTLGLVKHLPLGPAYGWLGVHQRSSGTLNGYLLEIYDAYQVGSPYPSDEPW